MKETIRVVSLSFSDKDPKEVYRVVEQEAEKGCDMIVLPETWTGSERLETIEEGTTVRLSEIARKYHTYILNAIYRKSDRYERINSSILIGRDGKVEGIYDKVYPFWEEFALNPTTSVGEKAWVFDTDFGKIGMAICFDANFDDVWRQMAEQGAEVIFWSSAYSAGTSLMAHAINYNYYIVSSTLCGDCVVYDITGKELYYHKKSSDDELLVSEITLDMNRQIFHENYNMDKKEKLLREHPGEVIETDTMQRESWFVLKGNGVSVKQLASEYGLESLQAYKNRSRNEIDAMRYRQNHF